MTPPTVAVALALNCVDAPDQTLGATLPVPAMRLVDAVLTSGRNNSDRVALLFLLAYKAGNPAWHLQRFPTGWRPADKQLAEGLTRRHFTLHGNVTSPGENMGSKGNIATFDLFARPRLGDALEYFENNPGTVSAGLHYVATAFAASHRAPVIIQAPPPGALVYTRALAIADQLLRTESSGHFPQFLVAALLRATHELWGTGLTISTQHPHAADTYSKAAGDVELLNGDTVIDAFEVTVRPDWKNRRQDILGKMQKAGLRRYNVLCVIDPHDPDLGTVARLDAYMRALGHDIAVVDIRAFVATKIQELSLNGRKDTFTYLEGYVRDPKLCDVPDLVDALKVILEATD